MRENLQDSAKRAAITTEKAILDSRESRHRTAERNQNLNPIQRAFRTKAGLVVKTGIEMIPFPITAYGPGDVITAIGAISGRDILSGDYLDIPDRIIYAVASAVPVLPATPLVIGGRMIRHGIEDFVHARKQGDKVGLLEGFARAREGVKHVRSTYQDIKNSQPPTS